MEICGFRKMFTDTGDLGSRIAQSSSLLLTDVNFYHIVTLWETVKIC
jgi:hypothetical protein